MPLYRLFHHYIAASILSYLIGMGVSFMLNRGFVFRSPAKAGQLFGFCLVNLTALACSTATLHALVQQGGLSSLSCSDTCCRGSMVINFLGYRAIFRDGVSVNYILSRLFEHQSVVNRMFASQLVKQTGHQSPAPDRAEIAKWLILFGLVIVTILNIHESMLENVAHDALPYMDQYVDKFTSEGRWINFALFAFLRGIPAVAAVWLCNTFVFIFGYQICRGMKQEAWLAICFGLVMVNVPVFYHVV
ncbi:GtrA family protein [Vibrio sp. PP-XX7]